MTETETATVTVTETETVTVTVAVAVDRDREPYRWTAAVAPAATVAVPLSAEPPRHCAQSVEELKRRGDRRCLDIAPRLCDPESGSYFLGAARSDAVVVHAVLAGSFGAFGEIEGD